MITCLLFEKFVEWRWISTESNGDLGCFIIINKTCISFNYRCSSKLKEKKKKNNSLSCGFVEIVRMTEFTICKRRSPTVCLLSHWDNFWERDIKNAWNKNHIAKGKQVRMQREKYRMMDVNFRDFIENIIDKIVRNNSFIFHW